MWAGRADPIETLSQAAPARPAATVAPAPTSRAVGAGTLARWDLRERLRWAQPFRRLRTCGRLPIGPVELGPGWIEGLACCGSVHACPVCSAHLRHERALEVRALVAAWCGSPPRGAGLLTLTVRHSWGADLGTLRRGLAGAWRRVWQGRGAAALRAPLAHLVRALDTTHGNAGWHPHLHVLALYREDPGPGWRDAMASRWLAAVRAELGDAAVPREDSVGVRWDPAVRSDYLLKLGLEMTGAGVRATRLAGALRLQPWQIADLAAAEWARARSLGPAETHPWLGLWADFARATRGARALTWSAGAHRAAERAVETELAPEVDARPWVVQVSPSDWNRTALSPAACLGMPDLLAATTEGPDATVRALSSLGVRAERVMLTDSANMLITTGGILDDTNQFAARRFLDTAVRESEEHQALCDPHALAG